MIPNLHFHRTLGSSALIACILVIFSACTFQQRPLSSSSGKTCEILIVSEKPLFLGPIGDSLRQFFTRPQAGLTSVEPCFELANVTFGAFDNSDMFRHFRNLITVELDPKKPVTFVVNKDVWASPQVIFRFTVPTLAAFDTLFRAKRDLIEKAFYAYERERIQRAFNGARAVSVIDDMTRRLGFYLTMPDGFYTATNKPNFMSFSKEAKDYGQNVMVSRYPYTAGGFTQEAILAKRNELGRAYIAGPADSSYMTTEKLVPPSRREIGFNGRYAVETRGLWKLEGDFMGGPFINYVFLSDDQKELIMIDVFLYSPRKGKRDLLMQLESIAYSFKMAQPAMADSVKK